MTFSNTAADRVVVDDGFALYGHAESYMFGKLMKSRNWEVAVSNIVRREVKPGDTFIDVGAGLGFYTMLSSKLVGQKGRVLSFEPHPENFRCILLALAESRAATRNVTAYPVALGFRVSTTRLWANPVNEGDNRMGNLGNRVWRDHFDIVTIPLDMFDNGLPGRVVMKIDVQGAEMYVLEGARQFCRNNRPLIVVEENERVYGGKLRAMLKAMGYSVSSINGRDLLATPK